MLNFRIETFLAVCQTMNLTRAAQLLHITQPAVSQHIRALEEEYGAKLFVYQGKQLSLTEAGQLFLQTAPTMRHDAHHLKEAIRDLSSHRRLDFGATLTIGEYVMPQPLIRLLQQQPELHLRMIVSNTADLLRMLDQGQIDFAIVEGFFAKQDYDSLPYRTERYLPVCAPDHPCAQGSYSLEQLLDEHLLVREEGSGTREVLQRVLEERNLTLHDFSHCSELGSLDTIKALVTAGVGISFFYYPAVQKELACATLQEIQLDDCQITHDFTFLWRKGSVFGSYYREVFDLLQPTDSSC